MLKRKLQAARRPEDPGAREVRGGREVEPLHLEREAQVVPAEAAAVQADGTLKRQHPHPTPRELNLGENFHVEKR